ncbi:hypothetical protein ACHAWF_002246 [Thalassiosira exigua]
MNNNALNAEQPGASASTSSGQIRGDARENGTYHDVNSTRQVVPRQDAIGVESGGGVERGRGGAVPTVSAGTRTATMVLTQQDSGSVTNEIPVLRLSLRPRSHVTWEEGVVNNEGLGRKSSKRCCIFHKQRAFGESSTESSEDSSGDDESTSSSSSGGGGRGKALRPVAQKKSNKKGGIGNKSKIPDYQRFHA